MISRINIFLLWLLILAIPVQGFAAVAQPGCAPSHPMAMSMSVSISMPAALSASDDAVDMAGMADMQGMHDRQHLHPAQHEAAPDQQHHASHQAPSASSCNACSSCAVCSIGAILPLAQSPLPALPFPAAAHIALAQHGFVGYTPDNPERPPSLHL